MTKEEQIRAFCEDAVREGCFYKAAGQKSGEVTASHAKNQCHQSGMRESGDEH